MSRHGPIRPASAAGALLLTAAAAAPASAPPGPAERDLTQLAIEDLLQIEVSTASRYAQKSAAAPAAVSVISAADIRAFGYRTLGEILQSVRGLNISQDRNYSYASMRGFGRSGDYNGRFLLLVDGRRINDPIYDNAPIGTEFPLDVQLIDRVEIVRGPGSSNYGSNAVFGVINVITRSGTDLDGVELAGAIGSFGTDRERASWGGRLENGFEWLVSGTRLHSDGQDHYYPEFDAPATHHGIADGRDGDRYEQAFWKFSWHGFTLSGIVSDRRKDIPTASYGTEFNDPRTRTRDQYRFLDLHYRGALGERWELAADLSWGDYPYHGRYAFGPVPTGLNQDFARSSWWSADGQVVGDFGRHRLVFGAEYQDNYNQDQFNFDVAPRFIYVNERHTSHREGVFVQDEFRLRDDLLLNAGLRYDHYSGIGGALNPRLALIWSARADTTLKLLYGTAFRAANFYERFYVPSPGLESEEITTYEFIAEHYLAPEFKLTLDLYWNEIRDLIDQVEDPAGGFQFFTHVGDARARGVEFELERRWDGGARLRASYAWQLAEDRENDLRLVNSPRHLARFNLALPLWHDRLLAGIEAQYTGARRTLSGATAGDYAILNLTLGSAALPAGLELSASLYNLLDADYGDPGAIEHLQDEIARDGRSFLVQLSYRPR